MTSWRHVNKMMNCEMVRSISVFTHCNHCCMTLLKVLIDRAIVWEVWVGKSTNSNRMIMQNADAVFQSHLMHVTWEHLVCISNGCLAVRTAEKIRIRPHSAVAVTVIKRTVRQGASSLATGTCKMHGYQPTHSPLPYCHSLALPKIASSGGPQIDHRSHTRTMVVTPVFWIRTTWPSLQSVMIQLLKSFATVPFATFVWSGRK